MGNNGAKGTEKRFAWVHKKLVKVYAKEDRKSVVDHLKFGTIVFVGNVPEIRNGLVYVKYCNKHYEGWVSADGIVRKQIINYAGLKYINETGKKLPVSQKMGGKTFGYIPAGCYVRMIARCGDWCLTNCGWSKFEWFTKDRTIEYDEGINVIYASVLKDTVDSYKRAVNKLLNHGNEMDDFIFIERVTKMEALAEWIIEDEYHIFSDGNGAYEKLDWINESLGIDRAWLKQKILARNAIAKRRGIRY